MKKTEENIPLTPLKRGGRGGRSVLTQWTPPHSHVEYKWCTSLPLLRGARGINKNRRKHTPGPFQKGRARRRVGVYPMECSMNAQLIASRLHVVYKWCASLPLLRGVRGMKKQEPHTPDPFEKGRARRRVSAYPIDTTLLERGIQVVHQPSPHKRVCADAPLLFLMIFQDGSGLLQSFSLSCWFSSLTFI